VTGEPTGILRNCSRYVKAKSHEKSATAEERYSRTVALFKDYNANGLTTICDRASTRDLIERYTKMRDAGQLTVRVAVSQMVGSIGGLEGIEKNIRSVAKNPLCKPDPMLQIIGIKMFLDGGM